jgi:hypothetical protein
MFSEWCSSCAGYESERHGVCFLGIKNQSGYTCICDTGKVIKAAYLQALDIVRSIWRNTHWPEGRTSWLSRLDGLPWRRGGRLSLVLPIFGALKSTAEFLICFLLVVQYQVQFICSTGSHSVHCPTNGVFSLPKKGLLQHDCSDNIFLPFIFSCYLWVRICRCALHITFWFSVLSWNEMAFFKELYVRDTLSEGQWGITEKVRV